MAGKRFILIFLSFQVHPFLCAQLPGQAGYQAEELLFRDESAELPVEILETMSDRTGDPINLNTATPDQLEASGFFTPFQVYTLIKYRERYGNLYSIYELLALTGFRESRIREIAVHLTVEEGPVSIPKKKGHPLILITTGRSLPESNGYKSGGEPSSAPAFSGTPMKMSLRLRTPIGKNLSLGLSYEKDAGEQFFQGRRPEFMSGYISYQGPGLMKQLIVGNFQLHHGLGLVNGSGLFPSPEGFLVNRMTLSRIKPYASLNEYRFEHGVGCRMDLNKASFLLWSSYQRPDLSLNSIQENLAGTDWLKYRRESGLHRTASEMNGRDLGYRVHFGLQTVIRLKGFTAGSMLGVEMTGLTPAGSDSLKSESGASFHGVFSLHGQWQRESLRLFGELAWSSPGSVSILTGLGFYFNDFLQGLLMLHHYGKDYRGILPSSYASGSNISNEQGIALVLHAEPGRLIEADFLLELFSHPAPRYLAAVPSIGYRYSCTLYNPGSRKLKWNIKLAKKAWQTTPATGLSELRPIKNSELTRLDLRLVFETDLFIRWQTRMVVSKLLDDHAETWGHAALQMVNIKPHPRINCTFQFVVFNVTRWENRIYLYEPGLYYSFNFPAYYGRGEKVTSVVSVKAGNRITLASKMSVISYHDRKETGTGNDLVAGNKKWEIGMQFRLNL